MLHIAIDARHHCACLALVFLRMVTDPLRKLYLSPRGVRKSMRLRKRGPILSFTTHSPLMAGVDSLSTIITSPILKPCWLNMSCERATLRESDPSNLIVFQLIIIDSVSACCYPTSTTLSRVIFGSVQFKILPYGRHSNHNSKR